MKTSIMSSGEGLQQTVAGLQRAAGRFQRIAGGLLLLASVGLLLLAVVTMLDVERAQGVGLYLAMQLGQAERLPFDVLVVVGGAVLLGLVLGLPFLLLKHRGVQSFFRLAACYFAFMPILSLAMLIHLFDGHNLLVWEFDWEMGLANLANFLRETAPVLFILCWSYTRNGFSLKKWHKVLLVVQAVSVAGMLFLPELSGVLLFMAFYLLLLVAYDWWESILEENAVLSTRIITWLIFAVLYGKGCCRMLELMSKYHL